MSFKRQEELCLALLAPTGNISNIEVNGSYSNYSATYSAANRLASVSNVPTAFTATYDAFGKRIIKTDTSGSPIYYSYGQDSRLLEELNSSLYTDYIYVNGRPIGLQSNDSGSSALYYVSTERLGTPRTVTDSTATSQWSGYFLPFGQEDGIGGGVVQNLRFPGQYGDIDASGWIYNLNRTFYSYWGRYNKPDPIGLAGGLNPYRYANDSPRVFTDPLVLQSPDIHDVLADNVAGIGGQCVNGPCSKTVTRSDYAKVLDNIATGATAVSIGSAVAGQGEIAVPSFVVGFCAEGLKQALQPDPLLFSANSSIDYGVKAFNGESFGTAVDITRMLLKFFPK